MARSKKVRAYIELRKQYATAMKTLNKLETKCQEAFVALSQTERAEWLALSTKEKGTDE